MPKIPDPPNLTKYSNLWLAGNYTNIKQKVNSIEGACESGRRCASQILKRYNERYDDSIFDYNQFDIRFISKFSFIFDILYTFMNIFIRVVDFVLDFI